jgi:hypothetical protein
MKLNKHIFWIFSLTISLISCWIFEKAPTELHSDFDYMQSLNLPPEADTPMIPIAGGFIAAFFTAIAHGIVHIIFLIIITRKKDLQIKLSFMIGKQVDRLQNIILGIGYSICLIWIYDYLTVLKIKFYQFNTLFLFIAILTTLIYSWWIINLFNYRQRE